MRIDTPVRGRCVVLAGSLHQPDEKTLPLLFAADAARELGAAQVGLVAPYLAYMRQDRRFEPGEAVTSRSYARLLSALARFPGDGRSAPAPLAQPRRSSTRSAPRRWHRRRWSAAGCAATSPSRW